MGHDGVDVWVTMSLDIVLVRVKSLANDKALLLFEDIYGLKVNF